MNKLQNELAVVVLFWNDFEKTIECLNSLFNQKKQKMSIVLVDNNSQKRYVKKIFEWLKKKILKNFALIQKKLISKISI